MACTLLGEARGTQHRLRHQLCGDIARQADLHAGVWTRLRAAVTLAAALSLPDDLHARDLVLALTFGVILFTLLVQGATMRALVVHLRLERPRGGPSGC